jgi:hypothetical protein
MAIAVVFEFPEKGAVSKYDEVLERAPETKHQTARSHHVCFETPGGGFTVVDVWDSEEAFGKFGDVLGPVMEAVALQGEPKIYPLHNTL